MGIIEFSSTAKHRINCLAGKNDNFSRSFELAKMILQSSLEGNRKRNGVASDRRLSQPIIEKIAAASRLSLAKTRKFCW